MPVYQVDYQCRYPHEDTDDGYYYWTNCYYTVADNPIDAEVNLNGIMTNMYTVACIVGVETLFCQVKSPPGRQAPLYIDPLGDIFGVLPAPDGGLLTNTVRVYGLVAGRQVWYKRWRVPLRPSDIDGLVLEGSFHAYLEANFSALAAAGVLTTVTGDVIEEIHVSPRVHMWQLRHGTKRRARPVFATP